jgi:hypothetical protein
VGYTCRASIVTANVHDWDTWSDTLDPSTIIGHFYNGKYFGSHSTGSFIFETNEQVKGFLVSIDYTFTAAYTDSVSGVMYYTKDALGDIFEWDNDGQVLAPLEWKSKTIVTADYMNIGAARVVADYTDIDKEVINEQNYNAGVPTYNAAIWAASEQLGCLNGPTDYLDGSTRVENIGSLNAFPVNGDGQTQSLIEIKSALPVTFKLFANKELIFQGTISSSDIFRLPTGYRTDTIEVSVSGSARVRSIHLGETPKGLSVV